MHAQDIDIAFYILKLCFYIIINVCGSWLFSNPVTNVDLPDALNFKNLCDI